MITIGISIWTKLVKAVGPIIGNIRVTIGGNTRTTIDGNRRITL